MEILYKYNPYKLETNITVDGCEINDATWDKFKYERLQVYIDQIFDLIEEQVNTKEFKFIFKGTKLDFEDIQEKVEFCNNKKGFNIHLDYIPAKDSQERVAELCDLFNDLQNGPFEDFKDPVIKKNFESAIGDEFEVSVIATMSSGKSTLINSLIGKEIMPSKQEACTATISRIKDIDNKLEFSGVCKDKDNNIIDSCDVINKTKMEEWNREDVYKIDIEGEIPSIKSHNIKLVLVDTPGPNNSRNEEHKAHTFRLIRDSSKPMVMYILNGTQLATNDDNTLLNAVADAMKVDGKQSKDRFLFVLNKMDAFDPENENTSNVIEHAREYLEDKGIINPNIYPASAELAKVIRMHKNGLNLTRAQNRMLDYVDDFIEEKNFHFVDFSSASPAIKRELNTTLNELAASDAKFDQALIHSGIPTIENAINDYLFKYAYTAKIKNAVDSFKKKIEEKQLMNNIKLKLSESKEERIKLIEQLERINQIVNEGNKAKDFKTKINKIKFDIKNKQMKDIVNKVENELNSFRDVNNEEVETYQAKSMIKKIYCKVSDLYLDVREEINNVLENIIENQANYYVSEYRYYIQSLLEDGLVEDKNYATGTFKLLQTEIPDASELINEYKYRKEVVTGEEWVENYNKKWYKPWTWFQEKGHYKKIKEERDFVNVNNIIEEYLEPIRSRFEENYMGACKYGEDETNKLKAFFIDEMKNIDKIIKVKLAELEKLANNEDYLNKQILDNEQKMNWLLDIIERLNKILEI